MHRLPDWAKLVRLGNDEIDLIAYYRSCTPEVRDAIAEFCRLSAETCNKGSTAADNVVFLPAKAK